MAPTKKHENLAEALAAAQAEMSNVGKNAENPHFRSSYADLSAVRDAVIPHLAKHGIACVQSVNGCAAEDTATIVTTIYFGAESLEIARCSVSLAAEKVKPPGVGKASSYLRRYQLAGLGGVAQTDDPDDDGDYAAEAKEDERRQRIAETQQRAPQAPRATKAQMVADQQRGKAREILKGPVGCTTPQDGHLVISWVTGGAVGLREFNDDATAAGDVLAALQAKNDSGTLYEYMHSEAVEAARLEAVR